MDLFKAHSQYREKAAIWRIFNLLPLYAPLAEGHIFRWFAINIPMDLKTGGKFTSDIDIIACLRSKPQRGVRRDPDELIYKTWEVKVSLLHEDGRASSLKVGKTRRTMKQLNAYRDFGCPEVSLLEIYVCGPGCFRDNTFPPAVVEEVIRERFRELKKGGFGYLIHPFELQRRGDTDIGILAPGASNFRLLTSANNALREPFSRFAKDLNEFFESETKDRAKKSFLWIVFCGRCRRLRLLGSKEQYVCPRCKADLVLQ